MEQFIRRIRAIRHRRIWGTSDSYTIQLPPEWAERMLADGLTHVQITEKFGRLEVTPLPEEDVAQWRLARRRERQRLARRARYYGERK